MNTDTVSTMVAQKAQKFLDEGRVRWVKGHMYWVQGDSGEYIVHVSYPQEGSGACTCPAQRGCSHVLAACGFELANPIPLQVVKDDPFKGLS